MRFVKVLVVHPYSRPVTATAFLFFHMIDNLSIAVDAFKLFDLFGWIMDLLKL